MKRKVLVLLLLLLMPATQLLAQKNRMIYNAKVLLMDGTKVRGLLHSATDNGLLLVHRKTGDTVAIVEAQKIDVIKLRKKDQVRRGALIGAGVGVLLGVSIGAIDGNDDCEGGFLDILCSWEDKAVFYSLLFIPVSSGIGAAVGSRSENMEVNGNVDTYKRKLAQLQTFALH